MKFTRFLQVLIIILTVSSCTNSSKKDYSDLVNPFIGTVGSGNTFLGAVLPYGMVQLGPYSRYDKDMNSGMIYGFSHTHVSGMAGGGNTARGNVNFIPAILDSRDEKQIYQSHFKHNNETASPGYYSVILDDYNIKAELTSTTRTGFHKYTFPESEQAAIVLKLGNGSLTVQDSEVSGSNGPVFFVAEFSRPISGLEILNNNELSKTNTVKGENINGIFKLCKQIEIQ